jgi:hypothetical protein
MNDWFKELNDLLEVAISYEFDEASQGTSSPATIRFTVTNSADPREPGGRTEVRFDRVALRVGLPSAMESIEVGVLRPGESNTVDFQCKVSELPDIEYDVSGDISTQALFHIEQVKGSRLPGESANLSPQAYLGMFRDMDVHRWLNSTIKEFPLPGANTTLAQLSELASPLNDSIMQIQGTQERLTRILQFISRGSLQDRDALNRHRNAVATYLTETTRRISEVRQSLDSSDVRQIASVVRQVTEHLERAAAQVDSATVELTERFAPS